MLLDLLHVWRDFFIVTATAGATLIGAMFVVISIGVGFVTRERLSGTHAYVTSTVVHLGAVVLASLATMAPPLDGNGFGIVLVIGGTIALLYDLTLIRAVHHYHFDWTDYLWYAAMPFIAYAGVVAAGALILAANANGLDLLAAALVLLLITGVRNGWDMILTIVVRPRPQKE
ncbi:MAG: hypothetical protein ACREFD_06185 [Stellaceae bacterium]